MSQTLTPEVSRNTANAAWQTIFQSLDRRPTVAGYTQAAREIASLALPLRTVRIALLATYTLETIHPYMEVECARLGFAAELYQAPFNSVQQELLNPKSASIQHEPEILFVAQLLEDVSPALQYDFLTLSEADVDREIEQVISEWVAVLKKFREHSTAAVVIHNFVLPQEISLGIYEPSYAASQTAAIRRLNDQLALELKALPGMYLFDFNRTCANAGYENWRHEKMWFTGRAPLAAEILPAVAREQAAFVQAILGTPRKCLVVDLDHTLWGGVIGEEGLQGIALSQTYPGNVYREVQRALLQLYRRGVLLAVNSKNNEADVAEVFQSHPDMLLRREHFAAWRVNWQPKPQNMLELAEELNIGLDSMVFLDDNPLECDWMRQAFPEILCWEACDAAGVADPFVTLQRLRQTRVFDKLSYTADDRRRGAMYREQQERQQLSQQVGSLEEFLQSLQMRVEIAPVDTFSFPRVLDLIHKTNQFNLTTTRHTEANLESIANDPQQAIFTIRVVDRFGDNGIVGVSIVRCEDSVAVIDTFLLSCRVIGRKVETALLTHLVEWASARNLEYLLGRFIPTAKNAPAASLFFDHGFMQIENQGTATQWLLPLEQVSFEWPRFIGRWIEVARDTPDAPVDRVLETLAHVLGVSPTELNDESSPATIAAWDSLNHLNLILALESEFATQFAPSDALAMQSVKEIRRVLSRSPEDSAANAMVFQDLLPEQIPAFQQFISHSYHPQYVLAINDPYLKWQFAIPDAPTQPLRIRLAMIDGQIAGCLGYIPVQVNAAGQQYRGAWLANWMVAPEHRKSGLGPLLAREVTRDYQITLAAGANEEARDILSRMGYTDLGLLTRYVAVLDRLGAAALTESGQLDWPNDASYPVIESQLHIVNVKSATDEFTNLWDRIMGSEPTLAGTTRSAPYLNWRYLEHPQFPYQLVAAYDGKQLVGYAVYRIEQARDSEVRISRMVELVAEQTAQDVLVDHVLNQSRAENAVAVDFLCGTSRFEGLLTRFGFLPDYDSRVEQIPVLYQPLDRRRAGIRYLADLRNLPAGTSITEWYVTKSDGDQDRPN
jgi:FkbH-like protein